ncbi:hypothetical protein ACGFXB_45380 [Streptomyces canus]|uniref:hypothetical protein n=1 Tax=Streptomyces canus TaxID=58343 RepID=UPI0037119777
MAYGRPSVSWLAGGLDLQQRPLDSCFPAAHERLRRAAATIEPGTPAQPFIEALTELVQAQAATTGFVGLHQWVEIIDDASWAGATTAVVATTTDSASRNRGMR